MSDSARLAAFLGPTDRQSLPFRNALRVSHDPSTTTPSPFEPALRPAVEKQFPRPRAHGIAAGLLERGLEVRLRGLQSIFIMEQTVSLRAGPRQRVAAAPRR